MNENLLESEVIEIKEFAQKLLNGKYYCGYNPSDEESYRRLMSNKIKDNLEIALSMVGYDLIVSDQEKTIFVRKQDGISGPRVNLDLTTTKLVFILKRQFLLGMKKVETNKNVFYKWSELLSDFAPFMKKANMKTNLIDSLWILKDFGLLHVNKTKKDMKKQDLTDEIIIEIFPSINCVCDMKDMEVLEEKLRELILSINDNTKENEGENNE